MRFARSLIALGAAVFVPPVFAAIDHAATIQALNAEDIAAGKKLYAKQCVACHGADGDSTLNPLARRFSRDELKFGADPYSLWKTVSYGNDLMFRWDAVLTEKERYQIVHYIRETFIRENGQQYAALDATYFAKFPALAEADARTHAAPGQSNLALTGMLDGKMGREMIYGPAQSHSLVFSREAMDSENTVRFKGVVYKGYYLNREHVVLDYTVSGRRILELPGGLPGESTLARTLAIVPGEERLFCLVGRLPEGKVTTRINTAKVTVRTRELHAALSGEARGIEFVADKTGGLWLAISPSTTARQFTLWYGFDRPITAPTLAPPVPLAELTQGGARRWPETVQTSIVPGKAIDGYAADEIVVPFANPWGSWMRLSALDFFADGRMAVSTLSGDVWIVSVDQTAKDRVTWSRFANGLYEPLGLRIVKDTVYVRCRDRIVRLRDLNADGEADFYESFYNEPGEIGTGYHSFIFELQTDRAGNFYYSKSGRKSPHQAAVVRVSPDGRHAETIAGDLRHPNGMGAGGPSDWITISDNPSGKAIYNGFALAREGASFGYERPRNTPMLVTLPASVDASSTGQCWSDPQRWGPLSGGILHTSYSQCSLFHVMVQDVAPYPNGFAVRLPFDFKAGLMRTRINPVDGQAYVVGLKGWDTHAPYEGCLYRVRYTGEPTRMIQKIAATRTGLRLTFTCDLDRASVQATSVTAVREKVKKGKMEPVVLGAVRVMGPRSLEIAVPDIDAERVENRTATNAKAGGVMVEVRPPLVLTVAVKSADGVPIQQTVYATINALP